MPMLKEIKTYWGRNSAGDDSIWEHYFIDVFGNRQGEAREYYVDGDLCSIHNYKDDILEGYFLYDNSEFVEEGNYTDGYVHGIVVKVSKTTNNTEYYFYNKGHRVDISEHGMVAPLTKTQIDYLRIVYGF